MPRKLLPIGKAGKVKGSTPKVETRPKKYKKRGAFIRRKANRRGNMVERGRHGKMSINCQKRQAMQRAYLEDAQNSMEN